LPTIKYYAIFLFVERLGAPLTQALGALKGKIFNGAHTKIFSRSLSQDKIEVLGQ
jgi:hypothetical protein